MTPAEQRVSELIDKWLKSLELHLTYTNLTDEAYWQVQPWVRHQRPARWILDLAQSRARDVQHLLATRVAEGDETFAQALELVAFLANLVGVQSIERFIPLAEPERENPEVLGNTHSTLRPIGATSTQTRTIIEPTREMRAPLAPADSGTVPAPAIVAPTAQPTVAPEPPRVAMRAAPPPPPPPSQAPRAGFTPMLEAKLAPRGRPPPPTHSFPVPPPAAPEAGAAYFPSEAGVTVERAPAAPPSPPRAAPPVQPPPARAPAPEPQRPAPVPPAARPWRPEVFAPPEPPRAPTAAHDPHAGATLAAAIEAEARRGAIPEAIIPPRMRVQPPSPSPHLPPAEPVRAPPPAAEPVGRPAPEIPVLSRADVAVDLPAAPAPRPAPPKPAPAGKAAAGGRGSGKRDTRAGKAKPPVPGSAEAQVIADAVRLIKWGKEWHELADAIARIAGRPSVGEVRKLLRTYKSEVERAAAE